MTRPGMTLVELMLSLALAAAVTVGVLTSLAHLSRSERALERANEAQGPLDALTALLRRDLEAAQQMRWQGQQLHLRTMAVIDGPDGGDGHWPCEVVYEPRTLNEVEWLVRRQRLGLDGPAGGESVELVGPRMAIAPAQGASGTEAAATAAIPAAVELDVRHGDESRRLRLQLR